MAASSCYGVRGSVRSHICEGFPGGSAWAAARIGPVIRADSSKHLAVCGRAFQLTCRPGGQCRPGSPAGLIRSLFAPGAWLITDVPPGGPFLAGAVADRTWMKGTASMTMLADTADAVICVDTHTGTHTACLLDRLGRRSPRSPSGPIRGAARCCWPGLVSIPRNRGWPGPWKAPAPMAWAGAGVAGQGPNGALR